MKKILISIIVSLSSVVYAGCYSEGVRVGTVQKFSQKGFVIKSHEGELVMDGTKFKASSEGSIRGGNVWAFSAEDKDVAKVIESAAMSGNSVTLKYCQINPLDVARKALFDTPYLVVQAVERK